jgi:23S rRNA (pseudouridine1915-N3)-methyltransferase
VKIRLVVVGRLREQYLRDAEGEYCKRLRGYCTLSVVEAKDEAALLRAMPERGRGRLVVVDERGDNLSSREFAESCLRGPGSDLVVFAVGGPDGHSQAVRDRADAVIAFGRMTIAHRLVRILLLEQIYRGFRILRGEPYHRD